jgi:chorismate mutase/prephenate dehydratase
MDDELNSRLKPLRDRIDAIDAQLIALLNQRAAVALEVGEVKKHFNAPVFRPERELQVIARLQDMSAGPLAASTSARSGARSWRAARSKRRSTSPSSGRSARTANRRCYEWFGQSIDGCRARRSTSVPRGRGGRREFGVVPVENSTEGAVSRTLDLLLQTPLLISGELALPIHHNLLTQSGTLDGVTRVCAHAQALAQCQQWLRRTRRSSSGRRCRAMRSRASRGGRSDRRGDRGDRAAAHYGCRSRSLIQDDPHNRTRFVIVGKQPAGRAVTTRRR